MDLLIALVALSAMEIVLGIDNIVFIAILTDRLPAQKRSAGRRVGLSIALVMRIGLLLGISWVMSLTTPVFAWTDIGAPDAWFEVAANASFPDYEAERLNEIRTVSGRDLILVLGGLFLIFKTVKEMHEQISGEHHLSGSKNPITFTAALVQIALLDLVFSLDSVITAVGMVDNVPIMITAMVIAVGVMVIFADRVSNFVSAHPTLKILALSFLLLIGVMLLAEGIGTHIEKGYIYFAMVFSLGVEFLNMKVRPKAAPAPATAEA
ncbi:MAG: TerC family protein [Rhodopirellula sp.]|nr:TerC family protein [Rhodopirellula sp.]